MNVYDLIRVLIDAGITDDVHIVINGKRYDISDVHIDNGYVEISIAQRSN